MSSPEHPYPVVDHRSTNAPEAQTAPQQSFQPHTQQTWNSPVGKLTPGWCPPQGTQQKNKALLWALLGALGVIALAAGGFVLFKTGADPLRTLEEFPAETYLRNHETVLGSRFRAELILDADLGGVLGKGRLFSFRSQSTGRLLPILVPDNIGEAVFDKGQRYQLELEVRTGGMIFANSCRKS